MPSEGLRSNYKFKIMPQATGKSPVTVVFFNLGYHNLLVCFLFTAPSHPDIELNPFLKHFL